MRVWGILAGYEDQNDHDAFGDPTHGEQQLTFFHGYCDQYQYLPRVIPCAENDQVVMVSLLFGTASCLKSSPNLRRFLREASLPFRRAIEPSLFRLPVQGVGLSVKRQAPHGVHTTVLTRSDRRWLRICEVTCVFAKRRCALRTFRPCFDP